MYDSLQSLTHYKSKVLTKNYIYNVTGLQKFDSTKAHKIKIGAIGYDFTMSWKYQFIKIYKSWNYLSKY